MHVSGTELAAGGVRPAASAMRVTGQAIGSYFVIVLWRSDGNLHSGGGAFRMGKGVL